MYLLVDIDLFAGFCLVLSFSKKERSMKIYVYADIVGDCSFFFLRYRKYMRDAFHRYSYYLFILLLCRHGIFRSGIGLRTFRLPP